MRKFTIETEARGPVVVEAAAANIECGHLVLHIQGSDVAAFAPDRWLSYTSEAIVEDKKAPAPSSPKVSGDLAQTMPKPLDNRTDAQRAADAKALLDKPEAVPPTTSRP